MIRQPTVLDAYCCAGGATRGYQLAGFRVTGVDIRPQPNYIGDEFVQGDAIEFIREHGHRFSLISTSPPCQFGSDTQRIRGNQHVNLIPGTREACITAGVPYVIENVEGSAAHLINPVVLCGAMSLFGLRTYRHRLFELGGWDLPQPNHPRHLVPTVKMGRAVGPGEFYHAVGHYQDVDGSIRRDMGMEWATRDEIAQAIPPAYTEWLGRQWLGSHQPTLDIA